MVYLPTCMVDFDGKLVGQDTIPVDGMGKDPVIHRFQRFMVHVRVLLEPFHLKNTSRRGDAKKRLTKRKPFQQSLSNPIGSVYSIFTYIYHILPLKTTKCR